MLALWKSAAVSWQTIIEFSPPSSYYCLIFIAAENIAEQVENFLGSDDVSNQAIESFENSPENCEEIHACTSTSPSGTIMKLCSTLGGISNGLLDAVLASRQSSTTIEKLCEHQHSSDDANSKNADNRASSSAPTNDEECKLKSSACSVAATSTFTSEKEISERIMASQSSEDKWNSCSNASKLSSHSSRNEILSNVEHFDD